MEKTLVIIKPDIVKRRLTGRIISIFEENGLVVEQMYQTMATKDVLMKHYEEHLDRDFYPKLEAFMMSEPVVVMCIAGNDAVSIVRKINGATNPAKSDPNTIRYLYGVNVTENSVHGSASVEEAKREIEIWFNH